MTAIADAPSKFGISRVIEETFRTISRNLIPFGVLAILLISIPQALAGWLQSQTMGAYASAITRQATGVSSALAGPSAGSWTAYVGSIVLVILGLEVLQAALIHGVVADLNGRKASFGECIGKGFKFLLPLIGMLLLMALGLVLVFAVLLAISAGLAGLGAAGGAGVGINILAILGLMIGAVILAIVWIVVVPALVVERRGIFGSFRRSAELTKGHRWAIFGLCALFAFVGLILSTAIAAPTMAARMMQPTSFTISWPTLIASVLLQTVQAVVGAAGVAVIYYELRRSKEGIGPEALAGVFD